MTSPAANEFLTKQINIQKYPVTFRWLSRALSIHVNVAKNELASFHASSQSTDAPVHATFLLTGDIRPVSAVGLYRDEDDMDAEDKQMEVSTTKLVLVGEEGLEAAKNQFTRLSSVHIYSLSPSVIKDAALLGPSADRVRPEDASRGKVYNQLVGIVVGPDVKIGHGTPSFVNATKKKPIISSKSMPPMPEKVADKPKSSETDKAPEKVKPKSNEKKKGTLDWTKAKTKADKEKEAAAAKKEKDLIKKESKASLKEKNEQSKKNAKDGAIEQPKRGTKRPSAVMSLSDSEDENKHTNPVPKTRARTSPLPPKPDKGVKVKRGVLISDDDDAAAVDNKPRPMRRKGKGRAISSADEEDEARSVRAMMNLDDSQVTRNNQAPGASELPLEAEDVEMLSDSEPIPTRPKAKRRPKKVIPVGRNGIPKKRVVKSRKTKNARGYTITEDYSSYESVSESEQVSDVDKKLKRGKKKAKQEEDADSASASGKPSISKAHRKPRTSTMSNDAGEDSSADQSNGKSKDNSEVKRKTDPKAGQRGKNNNLTSYFGKK